MSLNFPTAFWKSQPNQQEAGFSIQWETGLLWGKSNANSLEDSYPLQHISSFSFVVDGVEYNANYEETTEWYDNIEEYKTNSDPASATSNIPYFGWYLTGGYDVAGYEQDFSSLGAGGYANPWLIRGEDNSNIALRFETDEHTSIQLGATQAINPNFGDNHARRYFNAFIQSGEATGTFNVTSDQAAGTGISLWISASGLGEDITAGAANYNVMTVYVDDILVMSGKAPEDGDNNLNLSPNYDMQQVKLYATNALGVVQPSIINTTRSPKGQLRAQPDSLVIQEDRMDDYTTTDGIGTVHKNFTTAGEKKIVIQMSTVDGMYKSGSFYGLDFKLV